MSRWIAQQLIDKGFIDGQATDFSIRRTYAGPWQRSAGAWVWTLEVIDRSRRDHPEWARNIGSQYPATEIRKMGLDAGECKGGLEVYPNCTVNELVRAHNG